MHIAPSIRRVQVQLAVGAVCEPVGVIPFFRLRVLAKANLELGGMKITKDRVDDGLLIDGVPIIQVVVMVVKILMIDHLPRRLYEVGVLEAGIKARVPPNDEPITIGSIIIVVHRV
jgi:hypothetical protein